MSIGDLENQISKELTKWEKEYLGRGSVLVKTDILRNMIIVLLRGILSSAEQNVSKTSDGLLSIKQNRAQLIESGREQLEEIIYNLTGERVISFHTDISTRTGERLIVFILENNLQKKFQS
ncbi:DUF2294 domain-containing protein [Neobacillus sp. LXY-4]|uniref:DUF2294 domain-containing protein n=1 Tax=Neobacillus sp. LXY-4 TaxID=3379826 RepID=UPI003EE3AAFB